VVGGELDLADLEIATNSQNGTSEAPLQMKSNGGVLVIDDFGRNRFEPMELVNRLIMPLERRADCLHLPSGRSFQVSFDSLIIFSTNLDPAEVVDEAFLRRIPYSICVADPTEREFRSVFRRLADQWHIRCDDNMLDQLLQQHYQDGRHSLRFCHPRDLLRHIKNACQYRGESDQVTSGNLQAAVQDCLELRSRLSPFELSRE
jgi:predicted ATPase with chaperone activity